MTASSFCVDYIDTRQTPMPACGRQAVALSDFLHIQMELAHAMTLAVMTVIAVCTTVMTVVVLFIPCLCVIVCHKCHGTQGAQ